MTETKKLLDNNKVEVTTVRVVDRYTGFWRYDSDVCMEIIDDIFKGCFKIWTTKKSREGFESLDTGEKWEPSEGSVVGDIQSFQQYLDKTYGKDNYKTYAIGAYIHSAVSFSFNSDEDTRCKWDSGTVGFIGIDTKQTQDLNRLASDLTDAWNGYIEVYGVYDNYENEIVDDICSIQGQKEVENWKDEMKKTYGVTEYKDENHY